MTDIQREKFDDMRRDMLLENRLRTDDDCFYDHLNNAFGDLVQRFHDECKCYDREPDEWFQLMIEK